MPADWDEDAHPRDGQGRFAGALASWAERRAGAAARVQVAREVRDGATSRAREFRDTARRAGEIAAGKEQAVGVLRNSLGTKGPIAVQLAGQARSQRAMETEARERGASASQRALDADNTLNNKLAEKQDVLRDKPRREDFPEPRTAPSSVGAAIDAVGRPATAPQEPPATSPAVQPALGRVPRDTAAYGRYAGARAGEIPAALNHAHIANATRAEQRRQRESGQTPMVSGDRTHREFLSQFREQHRAALAITRGGAPAPARAAAPAHATETRVSVPTASARPGDHPNLVRIPTRTAEERVQIIRENTAKLGAEGARKLDAFFGDKSPRVSDFERGYGTNDNPSKVSFDISSHSVRVHVEQFVKVPDGRGGTRTERATNNCTRTYSKDSSGKLSVYHDIFVVDPAFRSTGIGGQMLSNMVRLHHELGVRHISTSPAGSSSGGSYEKYLKLREDTKQAHKDFREGRTTFDQMAQITRRLDIGMIGPHAWSTMGFTHQGSYSHAYGQFLQEHHHERVTKLALGAERHSELTRLATAQSPIPPTPSRQPHPDIASGVRGAHEQISQGSRNNTRVAAAHAIVAKVVEHHNAGTLTREHLQRAQREVHAHFLEEQNHTAYGSNPRVALNQAQQHLTTALTHHGETVDATPRPTGRAMTYRDHMTPAEHTAVATKVSELVQKASATGQGREIVNAKLPDGTQVGSHFLTMFSSNPHGRWEVKVTPRSSGWQQMKTRLGLHDLDP